jgi:hypothetical protein
MPLVKGHHEFDEQFTQIKNDWLRDDRISFKARGLLAYIESHSTGWQISVHWLAAKNPEGKEAIRSAIQELELYGYLKRDQENIGGKFGEVIWTTQEPLAENPLAENPPHKNTISKNTIDKNKERELFDEFWAIYPKKADKAIAFRQFRRALSRVGFETILAGVIRFANDPNLPTEKRFVKNPATWLNAEAWENGPLPERKGKKKTDWDELEKWASEEEI